MIRIICFKPVYNTITSLTVHLFSNDFPSSRVSNDRFEDIAIATHSTVSKMARDAPSNDDPDWLEPLRVSITINRTKLTQSPMTSPPSAARAPTTVVDIESDTDAPMTTSTRATTVSATVSPTSIIAPSPAPAGPSPVPSPKQVFTIPSHRRPGNESSYSPTFFG